jgi:hypothetical protein
MKKTFRLGRLLATPGALAACEATGETPLQFIVRHARLEPGELLAEDIRANEQALELGLRLFSAFHLRDGTKIWIITEADRSATTLLLPGEY